MKQNRFVSVIAGLLMAWIGSSALAAPAYDPAAYTRASEQLQRLVSQAKRDSEMPRLTNPGAAALIATLSDVRFLSEKTYRLNEMESLMSICDASNKAVMSYVMFDVKSVMDAKSNVPEMAARLGPHMERNTHTFEGELEKLQPFLIRCLAQEIPLLTEFMRSLKPADFTETRRSGLMQVRNGMFNIYVGALRASGDPSYTESFRTKTLQSLAEVTPQFASVLQPEARRQIATLAARSTEHAPLLINEYLQRIVTGMSYTRCDGLCALSDHGL